jgi:hydrogenase expression/formation protein HypD
MRTTAPEPFADPAVCAALLERIETVARNLPPITLMEVCGTHTNAFFRYGVRGLLPKSVRIISGPGCPVCVTPTATIDLAIRLAAEPGVRIVTFGDMIRVPGSTTSLERERARGAGIEIVYSPIDTIALARAEPATVFVFLGVGFETTAPTVAMTIAKAEEEGVANVRVLSAHKLVPPALHALLSSPALRVDGLILPGHVSVIIGSGAYRFVAEQYHVPGTVTGFEPVDLLRGVLDLLEMCASGEPRITNAYGRAVTEGGNTRALAVLDAVFDAEDAAWRGLGTIPASGLALKPRLAHRDALGLLGPEEVARITGLARDEEGCLCGEVLCGVTSPPDCPLYGVTCTPEHPVGPCMVSSEGTCAAYFKYGEGR